MVNRQSTELLRPRRFPDARLPTTRSYSSWARAVANSIFCRLRRLEGSTKRGPLALCTPTSTRRLPDLATALAHEQRSIDCNVTMCYTLCGQMSTCDSVADNCPLVKG